MPTYKCLSCGALYVDPQPPGIRFFHTCPPVTDPVTGKVSPHPDLRDERLIQDAVVGKLAEGAPVPDPATPRARIIAAGKGRVMVDPGDALADATVAEIQALQQAAGVPVPDLPLPPSPPALGPGRLDGAPGR